MCSCGSRILINVDVPNGMAFLSAPVRQTKVSQDRRVTNLILRFQRNEQKVLTKKTEQTVRAIGYRYVTTPECRVKSLELQDVRDRAQNSFCSIPWLQTIGHLCRYQLSAKRRDIELMQRVTWKSAPTVRWACQAQLIRARFQLLLDVTRQDVSGAAMFAFVGWCDVQSPTTRKTRLFVRAELSAYYQYWRPLRWTSPIRHSSMMNTRCR